MKIKNLNLEFYQTLNLLGKDKLKGFLLFLLFFTVSILEFFGLGLMVPLVSFFLEDNINNQFNFIENSFFKIFDKEIILAMFLLVFLLKYILILLQNYLIPRFAFDNQEKLRVDLIKNIFLKNYKLSSSDLIQLTTATLSYFTVQYLITSFRVFSNLITLTVIFIFLIIFNFKGTIFITIIFTLLFVFYKVYFKKKFKTLGEQLIYTNSKIIELSNEIFKGIDEIKIYKKHKLFLSKIEYIGKKLSKAEVSMKFLMPLPRILIELFILSFFFILISISIIYDFKTQLLSLIIYGYASLRIIPSLNELITSLNVSRSAKKSVNTLHKYALSKYNSKNKIYQNKINFKKIIGKNINFKYSNAATSGIKNFNFEIKKGDFIAIIGPSGIGKSTLIKLMIGFLEPNRGKISLHGRNQDSYKDDIQEISSYIPQDNFILKSTIRENITLENNSIIKNDKKIWKILKLTGLFSKVKSLPGNLNHHLNEYGKNFSGGQKQRISIARSLFHNKEILFFDEGTSSMDISSEKKILDYLFKDKNLTKIVISHRKNILKYCNAIIDFSNGRAIFQRYDKKKK